MSIRQTILEQYTDADNDQRLALYLIHRGLRQEFLKIDMAGAAQPVAEKNTVPAASSWSKWHRCCLGWMKLGRV